jgi:hypothetical protein
VNAARARAASLLRCSLSARSRLSRACRWHRIQRQGRSLPVRLIGERQSEQRVQNTIRDGVASCHDKQHRLGRGNLTAARPARPPARPSGPRARARSASIGPRSRSRRRATRHGSRPSDAARPRLDHHRKREGVEQRLPFAQSVLKRRALVIEAPRLTSWPPEASHGKLKTLTREGTPWRHRLFAVTLPASGRRFGEAESAGAMEISE